MFSPEDLLFCRSASFLRAIRCKSLGKYIESGESEEPIDSVQ